MCDGFGENNSTLGNFYNENNLSDYHGNIKIITTASNSVINNLNNYRKYFNTDYHDYWEYTIKNIDEI